MSRHWVFRGSRALAKASRFVAANRGCDPAIVRGSPLLANLRPRVQTSTTQVTGGTSTSKFMRCFARPSPKCMPKVRRVAEPQRKRDVLHRHRRFAQITHRDMNSELVGQFTKRGVLQTKLTPERARRCLEQLGDGGERKSFSDVGR